MNQAHIRWITGNDTGSSSKFIFRTWHGERDADDWYSWPKDADDFGRCYRLLKECPDINIECMRGFHKIWDLLVDNWRTLTWMYEQKNYLGIYNMIEAAEGAFRKDGIMSKSDLVY